MREKNPIQLPKSTNDEIIDVISNENETLTSIARYEDNDDDDDNDYDGDATTISMINLWNLLRFCSITITIKHLDRHSSIDCNRIESYHRENKKKKKKLGQGFVFTNATTLSQRDDDGYVAIGYDMFSLRSVRSLDEVQ